ncbi:MAG: DUF5340 domain-containing protein [Pseudanabaenaceae cyanobacterium SKYGB_i_bin29]|nr:DUF5340 domain-containing protein [Pseudanabaenaceae cyanobacterium SKYG29]MDW8420337.1 DUF5340 domain-containing protein [Pseudanabaenaceae cyanobacterium SKYGB_i_bin29]
MEKPAVRTAIPLPSPIHYELLLQLLERKTLSALPSKDIAAREQIQNIIIMLRKALSLQKQFEANCAQERIPTTHRWSLNECSTSWHRQDRLLHTGDWYNL